MSKSPCVLQFRLTTIRVYDVIAINLGSTYAVCRENNVACVSSWLLDLVYSHSFYCVVFLETR